MQGSGNISVRNVNSKEEEVDLTYKIQDCGTVEQAETLKEELDEFIKEKYKAVTTLDEFVTAK